MWPSASVHPRGFDFQQCRSSKGRRTHRATVDELRHYCFRKAVDVVWVSAEGAIVQPAISQEALFARRAHHSVGQVRSCEKQFHMSL